MSISSINGTSNGAARAARREHGAPKHVVIVGAGIAGIACAVRLAEHGVRVTLLETRKKLGGRATSYLDSRSGHVLDNCQHVVLGCCTNYLDLLARLSADHLIDWSSTQYWLEPLAHARGTLQPRVSLIRPSPLPTPGHYGVSFLRAKFLSLREALAIASACMSMMRADRREYEGITFGRYLASLDQPERAVRRFWEPVIVSACNLPVSRVSAAAAMHVFQEGFLASRRGSLIGVPKVPLVELYAGLERQLCTAGGEVLLGVSAEAGGVEARRVRASQGRIFDADAVVCAVPVERVPRLVSPEIAAGDPRIEPLSRFTHSPILGVHIEFDRPVLEYPHAVLVDRPTQWLFRKDAGEGGGKRLHAVISAADDDGWNGLNEEQVGERVLADLRACIPAACDAQVVSLRSVREKLATFAPLPGVEALRPNVTGPSGLYLAGDYTRTGWPATMEGAARSGYAAAAAVLGLDADELLVPPLAVAPISRLLGLSI